MSALNQSTRVGTRLLARIGLIAFGLGLGWIVIEIALRLILPAQPGPFSRYLLDKAWPLTRANALGFLDAYRVLWESDPDVRDHIKPGVDVVLRGNPEYPEWAIRTTDLGLGPAGFRDSAPAGDAYAVVLGDSFAFGVGVAQSEIWLEQLEQRTGRPYVNLGLVGASSLHEERLYLRYGRPFHPKIVYWMYFQNDLKENLRFAQWLTPTQVIEPAALPPANPCTGGLHDWLQPVSYAYEVGLFALRACQYANELGTPLYPTAGGLQSFCHDHDICAESVQARMLAAGWPYTQAALDATRAQVERDGAQFVVLIVPAKEQVYLDAFRAARGLPATYGEADVDALVAPVRAWCVARAAQCVDLTPVFRAAATSTTPLYFPVDIHWTAAGQTLVAEAVAGGR